MMMQWQGYDLLQNDAATPSTSHNMAQTTTRLSLAELRLHGSDKSEKPKFQQQLQQQNHVDTGEDRLQRLAQARKVEDTIELSSQTSAVTTPPSTSTSAKPPSCISPVQSSLGIGFSSDLSSGVWSKRGKCLEDPSGSLAIDNLRQEDVDRDLRPEKVTTASRSYSKPQARSPERNSIFSRNEFCLSDTKASQDKVGIICDDKNKVTSASEQQKHGDESQSEDESEEGGEDDDDDEEDDDDREEEEEEEEEDDDDDSSCEEMDGDDLRLAGEYGRALLDLLEKESRRAHILSDLLNREQKVNQELVRKQEDISRLRRRATYQQTHLEQLEDQAHELEQSLNQQKKAALEEKRRRRALEREIEKLRSLVSERDTFRTGEMCGLDENSRSDNMSDRHVSDLGTFDESFGGMSSEFEEDPSLMLRHSPSQEVRDVLRQRYMQVVSDDRDDDDEEDYYRNPYHHRGRLELADGMYKEMDRDSEMHDARTLAQTAALVGQKMTLLANEKVQHDQEDEHFFPVQDGLEDPMEDMAATIRSQQLEREQQLRALPDCDDNESYVSELFLCSSSQVPNIGLQEDSFYEPEEESLLAPDASEFEEIRAMYEEERERRQQLQEEVQSLLEECELQRQRAERRRTRGRPSGRQSGLFAARFGDQTSGAVMLGNIRSVSQEDAKYTLAVDFAVHKLSSELGYKQSRRATIGKCEIFTAGLSRRRTFMNRPKHPISEDAPLLLEEDFIEPLSSTQWQLQSTRKSKPSILLLDEMETLEPIVSSPSPTARMADISTPPRRGSAAAAAAAAAVASASPWGPVPPPSRRPPPSLRLMREPIPLPDMEPGRLKLRTGADGHKRRIGVGTMVSHGDSHMTYVIQVENDHGGWRMVQTRYSQFDHIFNWLCEHHDGGLLSTAPLPYPRGYGWFSAGSSTDPQNVKERRSWLEYSILAVQQQQPALIDVLMDHIGILGARASPQY